MNQLTLRQIPAILDRRLRAEAKKDGQSLNKTILGILTRVFGLQESGRKKRDLAKLAGTWSDGQIEAFERNTKIFDKIDPEVWKP